MGFIRIITSSFAHLRFSRNCSQKGCSAAEHIKTAKIFNYERKVTEIKNTYHKVPVSQSQEALKSEYQRNLAEIELDVSNDLKVIQKNPETHNPLKKVRLRLLIRRIKNARIEAEKNYNPQLNINNKHKSDNELFYKP